MPTTSSPSTAKAETPRPARRIARLDGKPTRRPGGRHAVKPGERRDDPREAPQPLGIKQRIGFRFAEWAAMTGTSLPTIYRGIKARKIDIVEINGIRDVPRRFAIKAGFITADDLI
jgi:predicted DNA-binding transcriptional regulator AlpA